MTPATEYPDLSDVVLSGLASSLVERSFRVSDADGDERLADPKPKRRWKARAELVACCEAMADEARARGLWSLMATMAATRQLLLVGDAGNRLTLQVVVFALDVVRKGEKR